MKSTLKSTPFFCCFFPGALERTIFFLLQISSELRVASPGAELREKERGQSQRKSKDLITNRGSGGGRETTKSVKAFD